MLNDVFRYVFDEFVEPESITKEVVTQVVQTTDTTLGEYWLSLIHI